MKKIVSLLVALSFIVSGAVAEEKTKKADNRLYSLDQFFKVGTSAPSCVGKYSEVEEQESGTDGNLYQSSDSVKVQDDFKFHGFYLFIPDGGTLTM